MFHEDLQAYAEHSLEHLTVEVMTGEAVASIEPTRVTLKSGEVIPAHTLVWGAGLQANPVADALGVDLERGHRIAGRARPDGAGPPRGVRRRRHRLRSPTRRRTTCSRSSARSRSSPVSTRARRSPGSSSKEAKPFAYHDKGTMAAIGRGAAVVQMRGGRTMTGYPAMLAWGSVHLALLSTGEDRAKAVIDWVWAGFTHERPGRIRVTDDESERTTA